MEFKEYIDQKKELQNLLLAYLSQSKDEKDDFSNLISIVEFQKINENLEEYNNFMQLLLNVANNYHRNHNFLQKIDQIISYFEKDIKHYFSNSDIFNIFMSNKSIILLLIQKNILALDDFVINNIACSQDRFFFLPELKGRIPESDYESILNEIKTKYPNCLNDYENKRQKGENDSYICKLIRDDSIEQFITFVNKNDIQLDSTIRLSLFETNQFLIDKSPQLIEYAIFHGSINIINYMLTNKVELTEFSYMYAIHSNNAEIISILEDENKFSFHHNFKVYRESLKEAIKCHHNDIADYIKINFLDFDKINDIEKDAKYAFKYFNYHFVNPNRLSPYFFWFKNFNIDDYFIDEEKRIQEIIILTLIFFFYEISTSIFF